MHYVFGKLFTRLTLQACQKILTTLAGSWYRGHEIARRGGIFYTGLNLGTLTAGLIAAGASHRLEGVQGMSGWRAYHFHFISHDCQTFAINALHAC